MNKHAENTVQNLKNEFQGIIPLSNPLLSKNPIGIELEIKWRDYFPMLWNKYLKETPYSRLSEKLQNTLTQECNELEKLLLPKLEKTIECGVPKGNDKYWEFAFEPVTRLDLLASQVEVLQQCDLIPNGNHSLHITVGNMKATKDAYYLLLILELLTCDIERINAGFHKENDKLSATWARKGLGGLFEKEQRELKYGSVVAVEMRTLEFNNNLKMYELLKITGFLSDVIIDKQNHQENKNKEKWNGLLKEVQLLLGTYGLADSNWKKPNLTPEYWKEYIKCFMILKNEIPTILYKHFPNLMQQEKNQIKKRF